MKPVATKMKPMRWWHTVGTIMLVVFFVTSMLTPLSQAMAEGGSDDTTEASLGVASALLTIPYGLSKIVYAGMGGVVGGFTWVLSGGNTEAAQEVWEPSFYGTYVITPEHLKGNEPVRFLGDSPHDDPYVEE